MWRLLVVILLAWCGPALAQWTGFYTPTARSPSAPVARAEGMKGACIREILLAQMRYQIPDNLLLGIGLQESGLYRDGDLTVWPYTANAEGQGKYFDSAGEAVDWVNQRRREGVTSIDVGCMQINLHWHPEAFDTVAEGFDPARNVDYAAAYLARLHRARGDWTRAAAAYHSATEELGRAYLVRLQQNVQVANTRFDSFRNLVGSGDGRAIAPQPRMPTSGVFWTADLGRGAGGGGRSLFGPGEIEPILPVFMRGS